MAQRRMISLSVIDTDMFLEMPITSRLLYYELCMRADDDRICLISKENIEIYRCK